MIESKALKNNMPGDPSVRVVEVYISAGHDGQGLPFLVNLVGFTSSGPSQTNWVGFRENVPERLDRLIGEQRMPPVVVAFPIASPGSAAISRIPPENSAYSSTHFKGISVIQDLFHFHGLRSLMGDDHGCKKRLFKPDCC
jgi:hypothetical protein